MRRVGLVLVLLALGSLAAWAAEVTAPAGVMVNGKAVKKLPITLKPNDVVKGPATVRSKSGDILDLHAGSELKYVIEPTREPKDFFFLMSGIVEGDIHQGTAVATPSGWIDSSKTGHAKILVRTFDETHGFFLVKDGEGFVTSQRNAGTTGHPLYGFLLQPGQGIEIWEELYSGIGFSTQQTNPGSIQFTAWVNDATKIKLALPMATSGHVLEKPGGASGQTEISSDHGSLRNAEISGGVDVSGKQTAVLVAGPGTVILIDNKTGKRVSYGAVKFEIIKRAISLTSEFTSLATSNFFGS